jgi:para-nitrobenzyl esterase
MNKRFCFLILLLPLFMMMGCSDSDSNSTTPVDRFLRSTEFGKVSGIPFIGLYGDDTMAWLGIPYAKPPTQANGLRWKAPQNPDSWEGVLPSIESTTACVPCSQMGMKPITGPLEKTAPIGSEDCLILAIWRPDTDEKDLPVYFWVHGGSNNTGGIATSYWGSMIANQSNMVVVIVQYRLGTLGWLSHPALRIDAPGEEANDSGNFGLLDIRKALEWVQNNIENFGGDPGNVLLAGESAGAHNAMNLVISPLGKGLFHKVLHQSGGMKLRTVATGEADADAFIGRLLEIDGLPDVPGGDVKAYLESKTANELATGFWDVTGAPPGSSAFRDGYVIPDNTTVGTIESGNYNKVPIILGSNTDEMKFFMPYYGFGVKYAYMDPKYGVTETVPSSSYTWVDQFKVVVPKIVADSSVVTKDDVTLDDIFPLQAGKDLYSACNSFGSLSWRVNFVDDIARALKTQPDQPVYAYLFQWDGLDGSPYQFTWGAAHATEIPFFFGAIYSLFYGASFSPGNDTPGRQALSVDMMQYMNNFVRTGNPNDGDLSQWEEWSTTPGESKRILWDATETATEISMGTEEYTSTDVQDLFNSLYMSLPEATRNIMFWFNFWPDS